MRAIVCMPEMEPLDILPCIITVHIPTFDIWTPSKEEVLFVNFSFMCLILTGFPPERNGGCAVQLPVPLQHTKKIMFSKTTNETAANAFFFLSRSTAWEVLFVSTWTLKFCSSHCFPQQPPSLLPIPCGLYSAVHE